MRIKHRGGVPIEYSYIRGEALQGVIWQTRVRIKRTRTNVQSCMGHM